MNESVVYQNFLSATSLKSQFYLITEFVSELRLESVL